MIKNLKQLGLIVLFAGMVQGCASVTENLTNTFAERNDDFGVYPANYEQIIRCDFTKLATVHHPESLDFQIRRPVKFYKVNYAGDEVAWFAWVAELAVPDKAVYKFFSDDSEDWTVYYARFSGGQLSELYHGEEYAYLKSRLGWELVEEGNSGFFRALNRGAVVNDTFDKLISFRDDLPTLPQGAVTTEALPAAQKTQPVAEQLRELHKLYQEGVLSEQEFTAKKKLLLGL